ncbi:MAG: ATP-binding protein [Polyangiales bacterium]
MALLLVDHSGVVRHADAGVRGLLGREAAQCEGRSLDEVLPSLELLCALRDLRRGVARRCAVTVTLQAPLRRLLLSMSPVKEATVEPMVAILIASADDRDEDREASAAARLRNTVESVIAGFAHEVRNPIAAILSITEAALADLPPTGLASSMLVRVPALVNRVDKLIKESLRYSRPRPPKRYPQRLRQLIEWSVELAQMRKGPAQLEVHIEEGVGPVLVDAEQIEQILVNLLCNARHAARTSVRLTARREPRGPTFGGRGSRVRLEVADDGPGVPSEHYARIFEPFFTTKANGTGLGLAIARDLARLNGGDLELHSTSHHGAVFALTLEEQPHDLTIETRGGQA